MAKDLLVVFGATGQQGNSIIDEVLKDDSLSSKFALRGLTRDTSSEAAKRLAERGVEIVKCDSNSGDDLKSALQGAHTVFAMTTTIYHSNGRAEEEAQGQKIADAIVAAGAQYLIWSSMISPDKLSGGKFKNVNHFESKYNVEQYIRGLPIESSFFVPATFMQNFQSNMGPKPLGDGSYAVFAVYPAEARIPLIDIAADTGKWIAAVLAEPEKYAGKDLAAATRLYTASEIAQIMSEVSSKTVKHIQIPVEKFESFLPGGFRTQISEMAQYFGECGYYGADMEREVKWGAAQARGELTTLEQYLKRCPLKLE